MNFFVKLFRRQKDLCEDDLIKPYCIKAREALLKDELAKAIAYLDCGIRIAPDRLGLYLQRAQIFQYGLNNCSQALQDYRHILRALESDPDDQLASQCKKAMKDMMEAPQPVEDCV